MSNSGAAEEATQAMNLAFGRRRRRQPQSIYQDQSLASRRDARKRSKKSEERQQKLIWYHANRLRDKQRRTIWEEYGITLILCSTYMVDMCYAYILCFHARSCISSSARKSFLCAEYTELGSYRILSFHYHRGGLIPASNLPRQVRKAGQKEE